MPDFPFGFILTPVWKIIDKWATPREEVIDDEYLKSFGPAIALREAGGEFRWSDPDKVARRIGVGYSNYSYREKWYRPKTVYRNRAKQVLLFKNDREAE